MNKDEPTPQGWTTHRGHDHTPKDVCNGDKTCRYGEFWPTIRLLPGEKERFEREAKTSCLS
jgi:hypothetical protein